MNGGIAMESREEESARPEFKRRDAVQLHLALQRPSVHANVERGVGPVAMGDLKGVADDPLFRLGQCGGGDGFQRAPRRWLDRSVAGSRGDYRADDREMFRLDDIRAGEDGVIDDALELAHVSWPRVAEQHLGG